MNDVNEGLLEARYLVLREDDLAGEPVDGPVPVFSHDPLWTIYAAWGWSTPDRAAVLVLVTRDRPVLVLDGHANQIIDRNAVFDDRSVALALPALGAPRAADRAA